ncbi:hypothetical protein KEM48_014387 [Puccinia striiformis f. sp. tritici PST-130]|nr:hypothetical protein KEM48_014387 [Puccinia striiformis f. sp. tritici PST-130]
MGWLNVGVGVAEGHGEGGNHCWVASILGKMFINMDKKDKSDFAFVIFVPTIKATGQLVINIKSGPFLFPKPKVGIDFSETNGIVRMIWCAKDYEHCTLPHKDHLTFTRLALSLQINTNLSNACTRYQDGTHTGTTIGDNDQYLTKAANKGTACKNLF